MPGRFHHHARAPTAPFGLDGASPNADIHSGLNGGATAAAQERNIRDAQEFELEGLIGAADKDRDEEEAPANGAVKL